MFKRTIVVGDLHGCLDEAHDILDKCQATSSDRVIFLGDLVDRGHDSGGCVDLAMKLEASQGEHACILGNHEQKHVNYKDIEDKRGCVDVQIETHVATRKQLRPEHYDYFKSLPTFIRLPEFNVACVHAGVWPKRAIEQQSDRHLLHVQMIRPNNPEGGERSIWVSKVPKEEPDWKFWTHFWDGPERIVFGHSVLNEPLFTDKVVGLDGGCCFGLELWALVLPDNVIVRVKSRRSYHGNRDRRLHMIDDKIGTY